VSHLGLIHRELQDFEAAIVHDEEGLRLARESGSPGAETGALLNLALDFMKVGRHDEASRSLGVIDTGRGDGAFFGWHTRLRLEAARSESWLGLKELEQSREGAQHLLSEATRHGAHAYSTNARVLLARVALATGDLDEAFGQLQDAVSRLKQYPAPVMSWRVYALLAEVHSGRGDRPAAEQARQTALGTAHRLAASIRDETLKERFMGSPAVRRLSEAGVDPEGAR
jgi:ATP/maltotriose-dependent transcriptional regulator MalT